ncbi:ADP-ribose pyrophosphatase [Nocardioides sp. T2.26MG-1]|nr:ADP-ribose pyrophosphatase [Nocardioides sp. T2.26MG-1]
MFANRWLSVREDAVRRPDGSTGHYTVVDSPDIALVIPSDGDRLHVVEQYRHAVAGRRWEFPSGSVDGNDADAETCADRELREETGLSAGSLTLLGTLDAAPGTLRQRCSVFLATELTPGVPRRDAAEQDMRSAWFGVTDVERMLRDGSITDAKSAAAYALLLVHQHVRH